MKEKELHLTVDEIDYLLKGMIHWDEIESRVDAQQRKPIEFRNEELKDSLQAPDPRDSASRGDQILYEPFLEGDRVYWILSGVGIVTLGTWIYFVFAK
jgi:hypothetical protein